jgi:hypothetical protein
MQLDAITLLQRLNGQQDFLDKMRITYYFTTKYVAVSIYYVSSEGSFRQKMWAGFRIIEGV